MFLWVNQAGDAVSWGKIDLQAHHNQRVKDDPITKAIVSAQSNSSSYTEVLWLDAKQFVIVYDRLARGWGAIPANFKESDSVWIVRGRIE